MTLTTTDQIPHTAHTVRSLPGLRRAAAVSAIVAFGLLAPTAASAGPAGPPGPDDVTSNPGCEPDLPCDVGPDPDPDDCHPFVATCDEITSGGGGDPDPCESDDPPPSCDAGPGTEEPGEPEIEVDVPVRATPNFTG